MSIFYLLKKADPRFEDVCVLCLTYVVVHCYVILFNLRFHLYLRIFIDRTILCNFYIALFTLFSPVT